MLNLEFEVVYRFQERFSKISNSYCSNLRSANSLKDIGVSSTSFTDCTRTSAALPLLALVPRRFAPEKFVLRKILIGDLSVPNEKTHGHSRF